MYPRHRWALVIAAIAFVAVVVTLNDTLLETALPFPRNTAVVTGTVAAVAVVAAWFAFRLIDRLAADLQRRHEDLQSTNAALRAVYDITLSVARQTDSERTIRLIVDQLRKLLQVDAALLVLRDGDGTIALRAANTRPGTNAVASETPAAGSPAGRGSGDADSAFEPSRFLAPGFEVRLEAPVGDGRASYGVLAVATAEPREFCQADVETLSALATQVDLALESARMRSELRALAVQGERERIAREMHDGLAQVLGYVNTKSQAVEELLADGKTDEASRQVQELAAAARSVYVDVREAILSLSPPVPLEKGLVSALEEYADRWAESSKLAVKFDATPEARGADLREEVALEVFGVAREALTNIRKHARAHRVALSLERRANELVLLIADDGVGFDPSAAASGPEHWPHYGLAGMRERAQSVGGQIQWRSSPGAGTEIELRVPIAGRPSLVSRPLVPPGRAGASTSHQAVQMAVGASMEAD